MDIYAQAEHRERLRISNVVTPRKCDWMYEYDTLHVAHMSYTSHSWTLQQNFENIIYSTALRLRDT